MTHEEIQEMRQLFVEGMTSIQLAKKYGLSRDRVRDICRDLKSAKKVPLATYEIRNLFEGWRRYEPN